MNSVTGSPEIEFLDTTSASGVEIEAVTNENSTWRWLALGCVLVVGLWVVTSTGETVDRSGEAAESDDPAYLSQPESPPALSHAAPPALSHAAPPAFGEWPNPPMDRDPLVVGIPGPDVWPSEIAERLGSTTIVYVNTTGVPTVVSFETGDVYEVNVAATRVHETFAVEAGRVVSLEGASATLEDATAEAIVFHTYRDVDRPGVGTMSDARGVGFGPELCLSDSTCARPGLGVERVFRGGLVVERFDPKQHWAITQLLEGWEPVERWLVSSEGYRIPTPIGMIWVIGPPEQGGSSPFVGVI